MNVLSREKQIEVIAALCEGAGQRAVTRLTGCDRKTVARLALRVGRGCQESGWRPGARPITQTGFSPKNFRPAVEPCSRVAGP